MCGEGFGNVWGYLGMIWDVWGIFGIVLRMIGGLFGDVLGGRCGFVGNSEICFLDRFWKHRPEAIITDFQQISQRAE
jgi:hypothetical protein